MLTRCVATLEIDPMIETEMCFFPNFFFSLFSGPITFTYNDHGYFYSGDVEAHAEDKVDWLEARNICREYCMDLVSIETPSENDLLEELIKGGKTNKYAFLPGIAMEFCSE